MPTEAPNMFLTLKIERQGDESVVHCRGTLVSGACSYLHKEVYPLIADSKRILLDLEDLQWVDSMGLGALASPRGREQKRLPVAARQRGSASEGSPPSHESSPRIWRNRASGPYLGMTRESSRGAPGLLVLETWMDAKERTSLKRCAGTNPHKCSKVDD